MKRIKNSDTVRPWEPLGRRPLRFPRTRLLVQDTTTNLMMSLMSHADTRNRAFLQNTTPFFNHIIASFPHVLSRPRSASLYTFSISPPSHWRLYELIYSLSILSFFRKLPSPPSLDFSSLPPIPYPFTPPLLGSPSRSHLRLTSANED